ncbi:ABC transporter permease [Pelagicoccus albus]|uniref:ABC transporter permease n=1 Tax=Pelagicoccus albus TaxID=415222 RepID=A0A7X1EAC5_9BACT|nr:ABC transporter permease [Pelagicoccus albus]MBC2606637.1 ABC transporter permease [Pelagicoccus albus]
MSQASQDLGLFLSLLHRFGIRYWLRHWPKLALLVSIVGLGTGAFLAIGLANRAATNSFDRFAQTVSGQSQIVVTAAVGDLSLNDLKRMRIALLDTEATLAPQIISSVRLATQSSPTDKPKDQSPVFTVIGTDLLAASNFLIRNDASSSFLETSLGTDSGGPLSESRKGVYAQAETSFAYGWDSESTLRFYLDDKLVELPWLGELPTLEGDRQAGANVLVMDWRWLSELQNKPLHADRVDIVWSDKLRSDAATEEALTLLTQANSGNWVIESQDQRQQTGATMTLALRMNLRALSALSLLVAICLLFQAMDSAVARRQSEIATLHSLGVSTRLTRLLWFADSLIVGAGGGTLGLALGYLMAQFSTKLVTQTVNTLYYKTGEAALTFSWSEAALAWILTVVFCALAGWWPARQAAKSPLIETMRTGPNRSTYSRSSYLLASLAFAILSVVAYKIPPLEAANGHYVPVGGYTMAITLIGLIASLSCVVLESAGAISSLKLGTASSLKIALSQFRMPVTRHRLALGGVTISVGMTAAMIFLIGSFESTVRSWITSTLQADLFIRPKAVSSSHDAPTISLETLRLISSKEQISDIGVIHMKPIRIQNLSTYVIGYDTDYINRIDHTTWIKRPDRLLDLKDGKTAIINESFASRFKKSVGDTVETHSPDGLRQFRVIGIMADYGNENGSLGIDQEAFKELTGETRPRAIALHAKTPDQIDSLAKELEEEHPGLNIMTNRWLREETLRIFNRVFSITYALEAIGLLISVVGLGSMLASLLIERRGEIDTLKRIGFGSKEIARSTLFEGLVLAAIGILSGLILGVCLGLILVYIINKQSFGWTLSVSIPWASLMGLSFLSLMGAGVVSYFVGLWSSRQPMQIEE